MSRRRRATKRKIDPDPVFHSVVITRFVNKVMMGGRKTIARNIVYQALDKFSKKIGREDTLAAFEEAIERAMPTLEVKSRRIGGATYQIPVEIPAGRRYSMAMKWIITHAREKAGRSMEDGLSMELTDCFHNQGSTIKKKDDTHRMAEANKAFAHFKW